MMKKVQMIQNEQELFNNLVHYEELVKKLAWRYWLTDKEARRLADYLRRGVIV